MIEGVVIGFVCSYFVTLLFAMQKKAKEAMKEYDRMRYLKYMSHSNGGFLKQEPFYKMINGDSLAKESDVIPGVAYFKDYKYLN